MSAHQCAVYSWKDQDVTELINKRIENDAWFKGKRGTGKYAWVKLANLLQCGATGDQCQKKWLNLIAKYKVIILPKTGESLEEEEHEAHTWPFFDAMNRYMSGRHTIAPAELVSSSSGRSTSCPKTLAPPASEVPAADSDGEIVNNIVIAPKKRRTTSAAEPATLALLEKINAQMDRSNAQIDRSLQEQAEARENERVMFDILRKHFAPK